MLRIYASLLILFGSAVCGFGCCRGPATVQYSKAGWGECPVCKTRLDDGVVKCSVCATALRWTAKAGSCWYCDGSGTCQVCKGQGSIGESPFSGQSCFACKGGGECPECNGWGTMDSRGLARPRPGSP